MWRAFWNWVMATLRRDFVAGLLVFVPIGFTILGVLWIIQQLDNLVLPKIFNAFGIDVRQFPLLGVITTLAAILLAGAMTRSFVGRAALGLWERVVDRIPVARSLYSIVKQFMQAVLNAGARGSNFRRVVLIEYPRKGIYTYAFVTGQVQPVQPALPPGLLRVFVPSTPNPTTGYFLLVPASEAIETGLSIEDAFRLIISAGIASPGGEEAGPPSPGLRKAEPPAASSGDG
ncbi:MAG: DUF502 domain-containing protein [Myxococcota bacterium]